VERKRNPPLILRPEPRVIPPYALEAPDCAQPGMRPPRNVHGLGGRDLAARNGCQKDGQHLPEILDHAE